MRDTTRCTPHALCATSEPAHPTDPSLALLALRYAAGELDPAEGELFEARLGVDQSARDAVAEAVRLSAAASGLPAPTPDPLVREATREKLNPTWVSQLLRRRPYRGHPIAWAGVGGSIAAVIVGVALPQLWADSPDAITLLPADQQYASAISRALTDQPPFEDVPVTLVEGPPALKGTDPLANPKLNPMRYDERSPLTGRMFPSSPSEPAPPLTVPTPMPTGGPRAEVPTEQEAVQPMTQTEGTTKKG